ncbi:MAG: hypothetical protein IT321_28410 [Anaerolineae bacterium]|nr:hypothetical protein [Anaerolineae bacterium]
MDWQQVRDQFPHAWVVVEAIDAYTEGAKRIANQLHVIEVFGDNWKHAWDKYRQLHRSDRWREYYVLHTDRVELNIGVMDEFRRVAS